MALALTGCDITELGNPLPTGEGTSPLVCATVADQHPSGGKETVALCGGKSWEEEQK